MGTNVSTNFITAPADPKETLGIKLPFLVMIIKNVSLFYFFNSQSLTIIIITVKKILHFRSLSSR